MQITLLTSNSYKVGDPFDNITNVGPAISAAAVAYITHHINDALSTGATDATPRNPSFSALPTKDF